MSKIKRITIILRLSIKKRSIPQVKKQKMKTQRLVRQLKSVAVLGTALVCLVLLASSLLGEGGVGVSGRDGASEGANTAKARIQETLGLFGNGTSAFLSGEDDGTRFDRAQSPLKGLTHLVVVAASVIRTQIASLSSAARSALSRVVLLLRK